MTKVCLEIKAVGPVGSGKSILINAVIDLLVDKLDEKLAEYTKFDADTSFMGQSEDGHECSFEVEFNKP